MVSVGQGSCQCGNFLLLPQDQGQHDAERTCLSFSVHRWEFRALSPVLEQQKEAYHAGCMLKTFTHTEPLVPL